MWTRMSKQSPQQHRRRPTAKRRARRQAFWTAGAMLIVFLFCLPLLPKFFLQESIPTAEPVSTESSSAGSATVSQPEEAEPAPKPEPQPLVQTVRFSATGDNLIHAPIYKQAQRRASGEEAYSFDYCYEHIAPFYAQHDVNWINQETLCTDELEPSSYPCFSTPGDCARALYRAGVRVFSLSNNHTYDKGASGIAATLRFWGSMPEDVVTTGLWKGKEDYGHIPLQTVNGVTIAYLSYTEHTNGIPQNSSMQANVIYTSQTDVIEQQVKAARQFADFVVVGVHWGVEDSHTIVDGQRTLAQQLADWGADVIVGTRGETETYFEQTCRFIAGLDVTQLHVFSYSERPGTQALKIEYVVSPEEKHQRSQRLLALSDQKTQAFYARHIGQTMPVLMEKSKAGAPIHGFTENYIRVEVESDDSLDNQVVNVRLGEFNEEMTALKGTILI